MLMRDRQRHVAAAQRRRLELVALRERIEAIRPRLDSERLAVAECLHLLRLAETADVSQHLACG